MLARRRLCRSERAARGRSRRDATTTARATGAWRGGDAGGRGRGGRRAQPGGRRRRAVDGSVAPRPRPAPVSLSAHRGRAPPPPHAAPAPPLAPGGRRAAAAAAPPAEAARRQACQAQQKRLPTQSRVLGVTLCQLTRQVSKSGQAVSTARTAAVHSSF
ncbi:hypothetical protein ACJJTC_000191 [Scirpophaga incertulas]